MLARESTAPDKTRRSLFHATTTMAADTSKRSNLVDV